MVFDDEKQTMIGKADFDLMEYSESDYKLLKLLLLDCPLDSEAFAEISLKGKVSSVNRRQDMSPTFHSASTIVSTSKDK